LTMPRGLFSHARNPWNEKGIDALKMAPPFRSIFCSIHPGLILVCLLVSFPGMAAKQLDLPQYSTVYDAKRDPYADTRAALKLARETHRKVLIEVGGDWCTWCHILDNFLKNHPVVASRIHNTFVVLKVNISDANDNAKFMETLPSARGYPHMYIADSSGTVLHSQDTAQFLVNKEYSEQQFILFLDYWQNQSD